MVAQTKKHFEGNLMTNSAKEYNDELMSIGYKVLERCKAKDLPCIIWGGGAIYHMLDGALDYRKMSDIEFLVPKSVDTKLQAILEELGFIPYSTFNNLQNMYGTPRREFYLPDRDLTDQEIEDVMHGRKSNIENVRFHKVEIFVDGIRMCWKFKFAELPKHYKESLVCPPGFQIALKLNPIHEDDFDFKDVQDISSIMNLKKVKISENDTIYHNPKLEAEDECCIGTEIFTQFSESKDQYITIALKNLNKVRKYSGLSDEGKVKVNQLIEYLEPLKAKDKGGFLSKMRREKPVRVDARTR